MVTVYPPLETALRWRKIGTAPVGGLTEVGFSATEDYLLVVSLNGRGVFDCTSAQRVARSYEAPRYDSPWLKESDRWVEGLDPIREWVPTVGLWGGTLAAFNPAGWRVRLESRDRVDFGFAREPSSCRQFLVASAVTEIRAFGFSRSGRFLLWASSSEFSLFEYS